MFANESRGHVERPSTPTWRFCEPLVDKHGVWIWADYSDNVLAVQVTGILDLNRTGPIVPGVEATKFRLGLYQEDRWATLRRTRDELVLLSPKGELLRFPLAAAAAGGFYRGVSAEMAQSNASIDLMERVRQLLSNEQRVQLQAFLEKSE
jgi:hypothetical protein